MKISRDRATRFLKWPLAAALLFIQAGSWAGAPDGFVLSILSTTQGNFGRLGIGAGYMGGGPYLDEKDVRRVGLHASLAITVQGEPSQFQQPDVREGQTLAVAGYRIFVEKISPGAKGTVVLRLWAPAKPDMPAKPAKRWPFSWFDF